MVRPLRIRGLGTGAQIFLRADAAFAAQLRQDPLVAKAMAAMMDFKVFRGNKESPEGPCSKPENGMPPSHWPAPRSFMSIKTASSPRRRFHHRPARAGRLSLLVGPQTGDPELVKAANNMLQFALKGAPRAGTARRFIRRPRRKCGPTAASPRRPFSRRRET